MGVSFSCPLSDYSDVESSLESIIVKSISFGDDEIRTPVRSVSFNSRDLEPTILKSLGSGRMVVEGSVSFKESELEAMISQMSSSPEKEKDESIITSIKIMDREMNNTSPRSDGSKEMCLKLPVLDPKNPKHEAAIKLQKVYKSFRTRRKLADCAVLVEQSWWKLLDFAELKRSSISYYDIEKHETAMSRWSRARTRAAKVGKGLSKNDKAQKLALQHWLEAIDPRHRYGHNLHFYYEKWLHCQSREPFFYWLDIGEGKEVNLVEKCPRLKLQQQCIKYLGPMERKAYEVIVEDGKFFYKQTGELLHTDGDDDTKWIFVLSASKTLYVGKKKKGTFQHSSFLAGGATMAAGRLVAENGMLKAVWPHSGHYRPTEENFKDFISFLEENNVDLTDVQMSPVDEAESVIGSKRTSMHIRNNSSDEDLSQAFNELETDGTNVEDSSQEKTNSMEHETTASLEQPKLRFQNLGSKLDNLEIPKRTELFERFKSDNPTVEPSSNNLSMESPVIDYDLTADASSSSEKNYMDVSRNLSDEEQEENNVEAVPAEAILQRINSRKGMNSYQLGKQLSCKWTTGAGPRIGCVRDYPSELQFRALEQVNLSPRSAGRSEHLRSSSCITLSPKMSSPMCSGVKTETATTGIPILEKGNLLLRTISHSRTHSSPMRKKT
ncbi:hypothetical protein Ddye_023270 [Dipteronia dyeriana]|uniref:IQ domain-containing protein IQM2-like n=1 Tax=Dipteronia dyeriana TaxID=168575 RepID=A0AAD9WT66_9ROSI|nr:hypothetical protein Ddye_023270 [Dipteronia dyeriana]